MSENNEQILKCDTCGKETPTVSRVVVDAGYNRANARPVYNCPECYEKKLAERLEQSRLEQSGAGSQQ